MARRYLAVVQDPRGYPGPCDPLEKAPPDGPAPPVIHQVVRADDYDALKDAARLVLNAYMGGSDAELAEALGRLEVICGFRQQGSS